MAYNMSNYLESGLINYLLRTNTNNWARPANWFIALCSGIPQDSNQGNNIPELANANGYTRYNVGPLLNATWSEVTQTGADSGLTQNVGAFTFAQATGDWGMCSGIALVDSGTYGTGNMWFWGNLAVPRDIKNGDTFSYAAGNFQIAFD
jgi:hypothetical protein